MSEGAVRVGNKPMPNPRCHSSEGSPASMQASLRRAATGILGGLFQRPLYRLRPVGVPSRRIQDFLSINDGERVT